MGIARDRESVFAAFSDQAWPYSFSVELLVHELHGGTPRNPDVVRSWLMAKAGYTDEVEIARELERIFAVPVVDDEEDKLTPEKVADEATKKIANRQVNGFKRDENGLYMEGRHLKACLVEAVSVAKAADKLPAKFGTTGKGTIAFAKEHILVPEDRLYLGRNEHDELHTRFTKTQMGKRGITVEEVIYDAKLSATIKCDWEFSEQEWAMIWLTAEAGGIGSSRSQGFGTFTTTKWEPITARRTRKK